MELLDNGRGLIHPEKKYRLNTRRITKAKTNLNNIIHVLFKSVNSQEVVLLQYTQLSGYNTCDSHLLVICISTKPIECHMCY